MSSLNLTIPDVSALKKVAGELLHFAGDTRVWLFRGEMGSGKTTLIKALCTELGSADDMSSPTFSIVNEYVYPQGRIFHFDLFRVKHIGELLDIGIDEYLASGSYCFFEWPELVQDLVEPPYLRINILANPDGTRSVHALKR